MSKLPILISIPHGGTKIPKEISEKVCLSKKDLFDDGDAFTREIYGIKDEVSALIETETARAFIDLNREITDRPPQNPDGIIKTKTCHDKTVYASGLFPDASTIDNLIKKYYDPYHTKIQDVINNQTEIKLALDCHTMEPIPPKIAADQGKERPTICLGNNFGKSCPNEWIQKLAECFQKSFNLKDGEVKINEPFAGGYITRKYGNNSIPWIQIELNRKLYLTEPWFDEKDQSIDHKRLEQLKTAFNEGLILFWQ